MAAVTGFLNSDPVPACLRCTRQETIASFESIFAPGKFDIIIYKFENCWERDNFDKVSNRNIL